MTNLGMIQALLKNNVISKGSFVFFDEPETNLHPAWQVVLTKVLIKLADSGVNVVMATHSLDMIKALEVHTNSLKNKPS
jgi:predicted ATPase